MFDVVDDTIVARWDVDKVQALAPGEVSELNTQFRTVVTFDPSMGTWKSKDQGMESGWTFGPGGLSWSRSSGKSMSKGVSLGFSLGGGQKPEVTTWDTRRMKDPLFAFLEANGWKRKRGIFG